MTAGTEWRRDAFHVSRVAGAKGLFAATALELWAVRAEISTTVIAGFSIRFFHPSLKT